MFMDFLDNGVEPVDLLQQNDFLQGHFGQFIFEMFGNFKIGGPVLELNKLSIEPLVLSS